MSELIRCDKCTEVAHFFISDKKTEKLIKLCDNHYDSKIYLKDNFKVSQKPFGMLKKDFERMTEMIKSMSMTKAKFDRSENLKERIVKSIKETGEIESGIRNTFLENMKKLKVEKDDADIALIILELIASMHDLYMRTKNKKFMKWHIITTLEPFLMMVGGSPAATVGIIEMMKLKIIRNSETGEVNKCMKMAGEIIEEVERDKFKG